MIEVCQEEAKTEQIRKLALDTAYSNAKFAAAEQYDWTEPDTTKHLDAKYLWFDMCETHEFPCE